MTPELRPAVFLDRDGTIIEEIDYLADPDLVRLIPGAAEAIVELNRAGFYVVVATNQSGIARGMLDEHILGEIHAVMNSELAHEGASVDRIEFCPHHPKYDGVETERRKPGPGMLLDAASALHIDLQASWMIGDAIRDCAAGHAAGARSILVETGKGAREKADLDGEADHVATDLLAAVRWILAHGK